MGDYRRRMETKYSTHELFNPENAEGRALREKVCEDGIQDVFDWLENSEGEVAVFDATNTTRERRKYLYQRVVLEKGKLINSSPARNLKMFIYFFQLNLLKINS